jgi:hypothetical protein
MSDTRLHYNLAVENKASQKCDKKVGPSVPKTDFGGGKPAGSGNAPHRGGKR